MGQCVSAIFVEETPVWEFRSGIFFVTCQHTGTCRAYPPNQFFRLFAAMAEIAREYQFTTAEIIPFPEQIASH